MCSEALKDWVLLHITHSGLVCYTKHKGKGTSAHILQVKAFVAQECVDDGRPLDLWFTAPPPPNTHTSDVLWQMESSQALLYQG